MKIDSKLLIKKFQEGTLSTEEELELESRIAKGQIELNELEFFQQVSSMPTPEHSSNMDNQFYEQLGNEKRKISSSISITFANWWQASSGYSWHWGYGAVILIIGVIIGINWPKNTSNDVDALRAEVTSMKEMMMLSLLENESTTDRLKAVNLTQEMNDVSDQVADALINTLRNDENNNVRMATIQVLASYTDKPDVREGIIKSIRFQESPLVQLALAELMVAMNEKKAASEFDSLWQKLETPEEIKVEIKEKMQTLI